MYKICFEVVQGIFFLSYFFGFNNSIEKKVGENFEKGFEDYVYKS